MTILQGFSSIILVFTTPRKTTRTVIKLSVSFYVGLNLVFNPTRFLIYQLFKNN